MIRSLIGWKNMEFQQSHISSFSSMAHIINLGVEDILSALKVPAVYDDIDVNEDLDDEVNMFDRNYSNKFGKVKSLEVLIVKTF